VERPFVRSQKAKKNSFDEVRKPTGSGIKNDLRPESAREKLRIGAKRRKGLLKKGYRWKQVIPESQRN